MYMYVRKTLHLHVHASPCYNSTACALVDLSRRSQRHICQRATCAVRRLMLWLTPNWMCPARHADARGGVGVIAMMATVLRAGRVTVILMGDQSCKLRATR